MSSYLIIFLNSMLYKITDKNIKDGYLSSSDFSTGAQNEVPVLDLSNFPYFLELRKNNKLTDNKRAIRTKAIYSTLSKLGFTSPSGVFAYSDAQSIARYHGPIAYSQYKKVALNQPSFFQHFAQIISSGYKNAHSSAATLWYPMQSKKNETVQHVFPGLLNEDVPYNYIKYNTASVIAKPMNDNLQRHWSQQSGIPEELLEKLPSDNAHELHTDIHEKRHLHQFAIVSNRRPSCPKFYEELDADLAVTHSFKEAGIGEETLEANLNARYLRMINGIPIDWHAASQEAIGKGQTPKSFFETYRHVCELQIRIARKLKGRTTNYSSKDIQIAIGLWDEHDCIKGQSRMPIKEVDRDIRDYEKIKRSKSIHKMPAILTCLRQLLDDPNNRINPFTRDLGYRICNAGYTFNPDLLYLDQKQSQKRLNAAFPLRKRLGSILRFGNQAFKI